MRLALGASRGRLVLQALTEVAPVLVIGGVAGVLGARLPSRICCPLRPRLPRVDQVEVNAPVLAFSMVILILTGLVAGVASCDAGMAGERRHRSGSVVALQGRSGRGTSGLPW